MWQKRLFSKALKSSQLHAVFLLELKRLYEDYHEVENDILKRENPDGKVWMTAHELPLDHEGLVRECDAGREVTLLVTDPYMGVYGQLRDASLVQDDKYGICAIVCKGQPWEDMIPETEYETSWIAFRKT